MRWLTISGISCARWRRPSRSAAMSHSRWPRSQYPETCSPKSCGSSPSCGRRPLPRQRKAFACHPFHRKPRQRCVLLPENSPPFGARPGDGALRDASARSDNVSGLPKCVKRDNLSLCTAAHLVHAALGLFSIRAVVVKRFQAKAFAERANRSDQRSPARGYLAGSSDNAEQPLKSKHQNPWQRYHGTASFGLC